MSIKGLDLEKVAGLLTAFVNGEQNLSDAKIRSLLVTAYGELTGQYAPVIRAVPAIAGPVAKDITPIICALMDVISNVADSAPMKVSHKKYAKARATLRMASLKAYAEAGFSADQAFLLVLQDASHKLTTPNIPSSSSKE